MGEFKCDVDGCGAEFDTAKQLNGHMMSHKKGDNNVGARSANRRERIPIGTPRRKLVADIPEGKVGHWFNDKWSKDPTRIQDALRGGYTFLTKDKTGKVGEEVEDGNKDMGSRISRTVGPNDDGSPITAYLMVIDEELYEEDQEEKEVGHGETDKQIARGQLEQKPGDKRYIPRDNGIDIKSTVTP